jgi:hypothetical protein
VKIVAATITQALFCREMASHGEALVNLGSGLARASVFAILDLWGLSSRNMNRSSSSTFNLTFGRRSDGCTMIPLAAGKSSAG